MTSTTVTDPVAALKDVHRRTWAAGRYADVAALIDDDPPRDLLDAVPVGREDRVLDVATGTGNAALHAARRGADVTGLDLVPDLLDVARERAAGEALPVAWCEGDAEALPFADASFDRVLSIFGVQFAPRHRVVADELVRVTRPGGTIGVVNWTPDGLIGRLFAVLGRYLPAPPPFVSPPPKWGDEEHVRALFARHDVDVAFTRGVNPFRFASVEDFMVFFEERYGPTLMAKARLVADGTWDDCRAELRALCTELNAASDGTLHVDSEYLVTTVAR